MSPVAASRTFRRVLVIAVLAVSSALAAILVSRVTFFHTLESKTVDYRFRLLPDQKSASPDIVLVEIDDASIKDLAQFVGRWPWPRDVHATLLAFLRAAGARLVLFDILFLEADKDEFDQKLATASGQAGNVVHAVFLGDQNVGLPHASLLEKFSVTAPAGVPIATQPGERGFKDFHEADFPLRPIAENSRALGHVAIVLDPDGPWRRQLLLASYQRRLIPSLPLAGALALQGLDIHSVRIGDHQIAAGSLTVPLDEDWRLPIWFNGRPGTYRLHRYSHVFFSQLALEENQKPILDPELFRDKIVIVGVTAAALHDVFTNPYSGGSAEQGVGTMAGMEVHANVLDDLVHSRYLRRPAPWIGVGLALLSASLALTFVACFRLLHASFLALLVPVVYLPAAQAAFAHRIQLPVVATVLAWSLAVLLGLAYQYWVEGAERRKVSHIFSRYVSRDVYRELMDNPEAAKLGGKRTLMTVLFSDLRGFTSISEKLQPEEVIAQLNEYFAAMVEIVFQHRGTVDKFVGDMIMALFNTPLPDPEHADHAVQCAVAMQRRLAELNAEWRKAGRPEFHSGVGINSGEMIAGNVGAESIRSYTVIGDNVNLGSRLESQCKEYKVEIIISEFTATLLKQEYPLQELGEVLVKGKSKPIRIFCVHHGAGAPPDPGPSTAQGPASEA